jgi:hypothetical protein
MASRFDQQTARHGDQSIAGVNRMKKKMKTETKIQLISDAHETVLAIGEEHLDTLAEKVLAERRELWGVRGGGKILMLVNDEGIAEDGTIDLGDIDVTSTPDKSTRAFPGYTELSGIRVDGEAEALLQHLINETASQNEAAYWDEVRGSYYRDPSRTIEMEIQDQALADDGQGGVLAPAETAIAIIEHIEAEVAEALRAAGADENLSDRDVLDGFVGDGGVDAVLAGTVQLDEFIEQTIQFAEKQGWFDKEE